LPLHHGGCSPSALGHHRSLIVAATGTGKTVIAAFDYARISRMRGVRPRLLFLAHRLELVIQARDTFRHVLGDAAFGETTCSPRSRAQQTS